LPSTSWRRSTSARPACRSAAPPSTATPDARQVFHRLAGCWTHWGEEHGYFDSEDDAQAFYDELCHMLAAQHAAPNSPQWFNTGLHWAYGIDGPAQGHWFVDPAEPGKLSKSDVSAYERPQPHACFIQSVTDDLVNEGGIMDLWTREARLFKYGSGTGSNFSMLRGENEPLSGGGKLSGLMSFLKIGDRAAGAIKSGGTTRRAAKMVCLDLDHPDIETFIDWKVSRSRRSPRSSPAPSSDPKPPQRGHQRPACRADGHRRDRRFIPRDNEPAAREAPREARAPGARQLRAARHPARRSQGYRHRRSRPTTPTGTARPTHRLRPELEQLGARAQRRSSRRRTDGASGG
jgi:hypothetical protein